MRITTQRLGPLATQVCGKAVAVELGPDLPFNVNGLAYHDGLRFVVRINPHIFERRDVADLAATFWHECHHVIAGDVKPERSTRIAPGGGEVAAASAHASGAGTAQEDAADLFAAGMRQVVSDAALWGLVVDG